MSQPKRSLVLLAALQTQLDDAVRHDATDMLDNKTALIEIVRFLKGGNRALRQVAIARSDVDKNSPFEG